MFIVFALIATLPLMALSYLALAETRGALAEEVGRSHEDTARAAAAFVGVYVENGRAMIVAETARGPLRDAALREDAAAVATEIQGFRRQSTYQGGEVFESVVFLNATGVVVAADPPEAADPGTSLGATSVFREPVARGGVVLLPVAAAGEPTLPFAAPLLDGARVVGVVVAHMDLDHLGDELQAFALARSEGIALTDDNGRLLVHPDSSALRTHADWSDVDVVGRALSGERGHREIDDPVTGEPSVAGYAAVPRLGWVVVDTVPTAEAYAALTRLSAVLIVLSGILVGGVLLGSIVLARRIVKPVRELTDAAHSLAAGRLATRIEATGSDEIAELGRTFNEMAARINESLDGLRRSEARYRNLVESTNDVILTVEPDGALSFAGPVAERILGWSAQELQGRAGIELIHPDDRARFDDAVATTLDKGAPVLWVMHRIVARDGTLRTFRSNFSPIFGSEGRAARVLIVSRDITAQRLQERFRENSFQMARLVSEETDLDSLATNGLSILLSAGPHARGALYIHGTLGLREAARASSGMPEDEPFDAHESRELAQAAVARKAPTPQADGRLVGIPLLERGEALGAVVVEASGQQTSTEDLDVLATLGSQLAVGLRRSLFEARLKEYAAELESRVEERTAELQAKSEEMESFLYSVSHDLKAPLISIEGYAQALGEDYADVLRGDGATYLERIRKNATLMETLILDILELSRIGRIREGITSVDANALLSDIGVRLADRFEETGGRLDVQPNLPRVRGEPNRIQQLLANLIENAVKYRHPQRAPVVRVTGERTEEGALLRVIDNGRGIPAGAYDQLFKIFQRLPSPEGMADPGGTGMGLAIVKRIVDTHGGRIWVGSVEGEGTVFNVLLPAADAPPQEADA